MPVRRVMSLVALLALCLAVSLSGRAAARPAPPPGGAGGGDLPDNPGVRTGLLGNGMRYLLVQHPVPAGAPERLALALRVMAGTVHEEDDQRGAVRAVEMAARRAIAGSPGADTLRSVGVVPESDIESASGFESIGLSLGVPSGGENGAAAVRAALEAFARVFTREALDPARLRADLELADQRDLALSSAGTRANQALLPRLLAGTRFAHRVPSGPGAASPDLTPAQVDAFRAKWVVPSNAVLVVAGSGPLGPELEAAVRAVFGRLASPPRPQPPAVGDVESRARLAFIQFDRGLTGDFVQVSRTFGAVNQGIGSIAAFTDDLVSRVAFEALGLRLDRLQGQGLCRSAGWRRSIHGRPSTALGLCAIVTSGPPGSAAELARCLVGAVRGAQEGGFSAEEIGEARAVVLANLDNEARAEPSMPVEKAAFRYAESVVLRDAPISAAQRAALARRLMDRVTPERATERLRERLDLGTATIIVLGGEGPVEPVVSADHAAPASTAAPGLTEAVLLDALDTPGTPLPDTPAPRAIVEPRGAASARAERADGGEQTVVAVDLHAPSGVLAATLRNGVTIRHRAMRPVEGAAAPEPAPGGRVEVHVVFEHGLIDEPANRRALLYAAAAALRDPALPGADSAMLKREMGTLGVTWDVALDPDAVTLAVTASRDSVESALSFVRRLIDEARVERVVFDRFVSRMHFLAGQAERVPEQALNDLYTRAAHPGNERARLPTHAEIDALTLEQAQEFTDGLLRGAPISVALVGDIDRGPALDAAGSAFGSLVARARDPGRDAARAVPVAEGPVDATGVISTSDGRCAVLEGFIPAPAADPTQRLARAALEQVLSARLTTEVRDRLRLASAVTVVSRESEGWSNADEFLAAASCAVGREHELSAAFRAGLAGLSARPVSDIELASARQRVAARLASELADPRWWADRLAHQNARGARHGTLDDAVAGPGRALSLTAEDLLSAARDLAREERRVSLIVRPE